MAGDGKHRMAPATARTHLGRWPAVQEAYALEQERAAKRKAK